MPPPRSHLLFDIPSYALLFASPGLTRRVLATLTSARPASQTRNEKALTQADPERLGARERAAVRGKDRRRAAVLTAVGAHAPAHDRERHAGGDGLEKLRAQPGEQARPLVGPQRQRRGGAGEGRGRHRRPV